MANPCIAPTQVPMENIKVAVRVRCPIGREKGNEIFWKAKGDACVVSKDDKSTDKKYVYDRVFNPDENNAIVYKDIGKEVIDAAMQGFNSTIFAYGQTASGKTYTMMGPENPAEDPGVIRQGVEQIFSHIECSQEKQFLLRVSYMEIYNECIYDLLADEKESRKALKIREDGQGNTEIDELLDCPVTSIENVLEIINAGQKQRHVRATGMNERSSRSHTIFRIIIESLDSGTNESEDEGRAIKVSHLNLVDLAGSERAKQTGAAGQGLKESQNINLSLMTLGKVISILSEGKSPHVPYRDSKLTRILKSSLGGNTKTAIICTVTAAEEEQTKSTLEFASRAKSIENHAEVNEILDERARLKQQKNLIRDLQIKIEELQKGTPEIENQKLEQEIQAKTEKEKWLNNKVLYYEQKLRSFQEQRLEPTKERTETSKGARNLRRATMCAPPTSALNRKSYGGILGFEKSNKEVMEFKIPVNSQLEESYKKDNLVTSEKIRKENPSSIPTLSENESIDSLSEHSPCKNDACFPERPLLSLQDQISLPLLDQICKLKTEISILRSENQGYKDIPGIELDKSKRVLPINSVKTLPTFSVGDTCVNKRPRKRRSKNVRFFDSPMQERIQEESDTDDIDTTTLEEQKIVHGEVRNEDFAGELSRINDSTYDDLQYDVELQSIRSDIQVDKLVRIVSSMQVDCFDIKARATVLRDELQGENHNISMAEVVIPDLCSEAEDGMVLYDTLPSNSIQGIDCKTVPVNVLKQDELEAQLICSQNAVQQKDKELSQLKSELKEIKSSQLHQHEKPANRLNELLEQKEKIISSGDEKILQLQRELESTKSELRVLLSNNDMYKKTEAESNHLKKQINENKALEEKIELLSFELQEKEVIIDSFSTETQEINDKCRYLENDISEKTTEIEVLRKELNAVNSINEVKGNAESKDPDLHEAYAKSLVEQATQEINSRNKIDEDPFTPPVNINTGVEEFLKNITCLENELEAKKLENYDLMNKLSKQDDSIDPLQAKNKELVKQIEDLEEVKEKQTIDANKLKQDLAKEMSNSRMLVENSVTKSNQMNAHMEEVHRKLAILEDEVETKRQEVESLNHIMSQERDDNTKSVEVSELKQKLSDQVIIIAKTEEEKLRSLAELSAKCQEHVKKIHTLEENIEIQNKEVVELRNDLVNERQIKISLTTDSIIANDKMNAEIVELAENISLLKEDVEAKGLEVKSLNNQLSKEREDNKLCIELEKESDELKEKLKLIDQLNTKNEELIKQTKVLEEVIEIKSKEAHELSNDFVNEKTKTNKIVQENVMKREQMKDQVEELRRKTEHLEAEINAKNIEVDDLRHQLSKECEVLSEYVELDKEAKELKENLTSQLNTNANIQEKMITTIGQLNAKNKEMEKKIETLEDEKELQAKEADALRQELANEKDNNIKLTEKSITRSDNLNAQVEELVRKIAGFEDEVESKTLEIENLGNKIRNEYENNQSQIQESSRKNDQLNDASEQLSKRIACLEKEVETNVLEAEDLKNKLVQEQQSHKNYSELAKDKEDEVEDLLALLEEKGEYLTKRNADVVNLELELNSTKHTLVEMENSIKELHMSIQDQETMIKEVYNENEKLKASGKQKDQETLDNPVKEIIRKLRKDLCSKEIENASLRADQIRIQGQKEEIVRKLTTDADFEKSQVKRLKDEIRRLTSRTSDQDSRLKSSKEPSRVASTVAALESSFIGDGNIGNRVPLRAVMHSRDNEMNKNHSQNQSAPKPEKPATENEEPNFQPTNKEKYNKAMNIFERGVWQGAGSGIMKEDALETAKHRVHVLEKELFQKQKIEQQLRHERQTYYESGGKWKTSFKQLEYKLVKRGCMSCKDFIANEKGEKGLVLDTIHQ